jgi:hypothetical protein
MTPQPYDASEKVAVFEVAYNPKDCRACLHEKRPGWTAKARSNTIMGLDPFAASDLRLLCQHLGNPLRKVLLALFAALLIVSYDLLSVGELAAIEVIKSPSVHLVLRAIGTETAISDGLVFSYLGAIIRLTIDSLRYKKSSYLPQTAMSFSFVLTRPLLHPFIS